MKNIFISFYQRKNFKSILKSITFKLPFFFLLAALLSSWIIPLILYHRVFKFLFALEADYNIDKPYYLFDDAKLKGFALFTIAAVLSWWFFLIWRFGTSGLLISIFQITYIILWFLLFGFFNFNMTELLLSENIKDNFFTIKFIGFHYGLFDNKSLGSLLFMPLKLIFIFNGFFLLISSYWNLRFLHLIKLNLKTKLNLFQALQKQLWLQFKIFWFYIFLFTIFIIMFYSFYFSASFVNKNIKNIDFIVKYFLQNLWINFIFIVLMILLSFIVNVLCFGFFCLLWFWTFPNYAKNALRYDTNLFDWLKNNIYHDFNRFRIFLKTKKIINNTVNFFKNISQKIITFFRSNKLFLKKNVQIGFLTFLSLGILFIWLLKSNFIFLNEQNLSAQVLTVQLLYDWILFVKIVLPILGLIWLSVWIFFVARLGILVGNIAFGKVIVHNLILLAVGFGAQHLNMILYLFIFFSTFEILYIYQQAIDTSWKYRHLLSVRETWRATYRQTILESKNKFKMDFSIKFFLFIIFSIGFWFLNASFQKSFFRFFANPYHLGFFIGLIIYYQFLFPYLSRHTKKSLAWAKFYQMQWYDKWRYAQFQNVRKGKVREQIISGIND